MTKGSVGPIWSEGREIIRRIFVTVRDKNWQEIAPREWDTQVDSASGRTLISARHTSDVVDFSWRGELRVSGNGREVEFSFTGEVPRDMDVCRLGLVVLHPVEWMVGAEIRAENSQSKQSLRLSDSIGPQPIVDGIPGAITQPFSTLHIERPGLGKLELRFEGDLFELEDQRNWGDASFKTYCTPLRLGFPRAVKAGTVIAHRVHVRFSPESVSKAFPLIGCEWPSSTGNEPRWRYVHVRSLAKLKLLLEAPLSTQLEIALQTNEPEQLRETLSILFKHRQRVARLLIYKSGTSVPTSDDLQRLLSVLKDYPTLVDVPILAATQGYFVEFNRSVPLDRQFSGIAFPLTATVHSDDADTILDNMGTIHAIADTSRNLLPASSIVLAPLAFYYPSHDPRRQFPASLARSWLVASLIEAALSGVSSVTLADDVIRELARPPLSEREPSLSSLVECSGSKVLRFNGAVRAGIHVIVVNSESHASPRVLAANLTSSPQSLSFSCGKLDVPAFGTRMQPI